MKVAFSTLGCKTNQYETALMCEDLRGENEIIPFDQDADIYIINTCTVTQKADYRSRQTIRKAIRKGPDAKVIVTGCYAERVPEELKAIGACTVIGNRVKNQIKRYLDNITKENELPAYGTVGTDNGTFRCRATFHTGRTRAFLKIQEGCNYKCSYCIVPIVRGKSQSASIKNVCEEVKALIDGGYKEVVLTGIQLGAYGEDLKPNTNLYELLKELLKIDGNFRLRLSSIEPQDITQEIIEIIKSSPKICRHLHIPLQSGDDRILNAMGRGYTTAYYKELVMSLINNIPDIGLGTDVIVGFPGESEKHYHNTYNLLNDLPLSYFHIFSYSDRPNTPIYRLKDKVPFKKTKGRNKQLQLLSEKKGIAFKNSMIGKQVEVLVENKSISSGYIKGLTGNYLRLNLKNINYMEGEIIRLKVEGM